MTTGNIEDKFARLRESLNGRDEDGIQRAIFELGTAHNNSWPIPDEVIERLLALLREDGMFASPFAGHILNFFEFEAPQLRPNQKRLCREFLKLYGDSLTDTHSCQVVAELREDNYLAPPR